jgi:Domain of unknown function (DUF4279)
MRTFRTLRGAVEGNEPDEPAYFCYMASLRIFGDDLPFDQISTALALVPTSTARRGDRRGPRSPARKDDMWCYSPALAEERPLHEHVDALWSAIRPGAIYLRELKKTSRVDVFLGYRSNIDTAGVEVPHESLGMFTALEVPFSLSIIIA